MNGYLPLWNGQNGSQRYTASVLYWIAILCSPDNTTNGTVQNSGSGANTRTIGTSILLALIGLGSRLWRCWSGWRILTGTLVARLWRLVPHAGSTIDGLIDALSQPWGAHVVSDWGGTHGAPRYRSASRHGRHSLSGLHTQTLPHRLLITPITDV